MVIAVPSKSRAGRAPTLTYLGHLATAFVPENEYNAYRLVYPAVRVEAVPLTVRGITATRNWILDNVQDARVVFVDDDLKTQGYMELLGQSARQRKLKPHQWVAEWARLFEITEQLALRVWGVATDGALRSVYPWKPFIWHTYLTASCMGIVNDGRTRFDESFPVKEDYELGLRCVAEDGAIVGARYLYWVNAHWGTEGGCRDYRTQEMERKAIDRLTGMYPGIVRQVERGGSTFSIDLEF